MKKTNKLLTVAVMSVIVLASCKNGKSISPIKNALKAQDSMFVDYKTRLADSVLVRVDSLAELFFENCEKGGLLVDNVLTEQEKMVKPDYLYDPSAIGSLVTKSQKTAALAFLISERPLRQAYGMPVDAVDQAIAKLQIELNYPLSVDDFDSLPLSDRIRKIYAECRKRNELVYFWEIQSDAIANVSYLLAQNPTLYCSKMDDSQLRAFGNVWEYMMQTMRTIAQFDKEMARILANVDNASILTRKEMDSLTVGSLMTIAVERKQKFIDRRNRLIR